METIFSKIIRREIPATIVYEDDLLIAFLDINPVTKGHTLLVPKEPYTWFQDMPDDLWQSLTQKAKEFAPKLKEVIGCDYIELVIQGKEVPHVHIHLIPGMMNSSTAVWNKTSYEAGEEAEYAEKIAKKLS